MPLSRPRNEAKPGLRYCFDQASRRVAVICALPFQSFGSGLDQEIAERTGLMRLELKSGKILDMVRKERRMVDKNQEYQALSRRNREI